MDYLYIWTTSLILGLSFYQIHSWEKVCDRSSGNLPCKLYKKTCLDCSSRNLNEFSLLQPDISHVDLSCNEFSMIPPSIFVDQCQLQDISLKGNRLSSIEGSPFSTLAQLITLDLSNNEINMMTTGAFHGLQNLQDLILSNNRLGSLSVGIFDKLKSLKNLDLSSNLFQAIPTESISSLYYLESLIMKYNPFESFKFKDHNDPANNLKQLVLGQNEMKMLNLTDDTFKYLQDSPLETLQLEWFGKVPMDDGLLAPLKEIKSLSIPHVSKQILESIDEIDEIKISNRLIDDMFPDNLLTTESLSFLKKFNHSLTKLLLSTSLIRTDGSPFQNFQNLQVLNLTQNLLSDMSPEMFYGLNRLETLDLSQNSMRDVPWDALSYFKNSTHLTDLLLSKNQINLIYLMLGDISLKSLRRLDFSDNQQEISFQHIIRGSNSFPFSEVHPINPIDLYPIGPHANFRLTKIAPNLEWVSFRSSGPVEIAMLNSSSMLTYLDLSKCGIDEIDFAKKFSTLTLPHLKTLKLSENNILSIYANAFHSSSLLIELDLSFNDIHIIESGTFSHLKHLTHLNLEKNFLTSVNDIPSIATLKHLNLASNLIGVVPVEFLSRNNFPNLEVIDFSGNPYKCDSAIFGFVEWIRNDETIKLEPHLMYKCSYPSDKIGMNLTDLDTYVFLDTLLGQFVVIGIPCIVVALVVIALSWRFYIKKKPEPVSQAKYFDPYNDEDGLLISTSSRNMGTYSMKIMKKPPPEKYRA